MTQELILTRGVPASGKSTWAQQWVSQDPANRERVNRDDIRFQLFNTYMPLDSEGKPDKNKENQVTQVEQSLIRNALRQGKSVVSDNTHLVPRGWKSYFALADEAGVKVRNKDFPISLDEAKRRNAARDRVVPEFVLDNMYSRLGPNGEFHYFDRSYTPTPFRKPLKKGGHGIVFDMDGTLSDIRQWRHLVAPGQKFRDFDTFHRSSFFSPPNEEVLQMAHDAQEAGLAIVIVTARSEPYREVTELWLKNHDVDFDNIYMRAEGDNRKDYDVKREILADILEDYDIVHAVDDNPAVNRMWFQSAGILTTIVPGFNEGEVDPKEQPHIENLLRSGGCLRCGKPLKSGAAIGPRCMLKV